MTKTNNKPKVRGSTADLIIAHSRAHLAARPHLLIRETLPDFSSFISPLIFAFAGLVVIAAAVHLVIATQVGPSEFVATNATDYVAQQNFYAAAPVETLHGAADMTVITEKLHAAAAATELSKILNVIGALLVVAALFYLHREHDVFALGKVKFKIRRIR
ncbi:MAG: hypothetical protein WCV72_05130 [Patescibacteria group bacterium]